MSKVSDALRRASEDNGQKIAQAIDQKEQETGAGNSASSHGGAVAQSSMIARSAENGPEGVRFSSGHDSRAAAVVGPGIPNLPDSYLTRKRGFKEAMENLLFGRDLAKYDAYPLVAMGENSQGGEQFKILREQITKICGDGCARTILVTSPVQGDGKTTVAANLAAAMALDYEQQVVLIDADIRKPSIHKYFGIHLTPGLTEYLDSNNGVDLASYVQSTSLPGLRILPAGKTSTRSAELLAAEKMRTLISEIPEMFPGHQVIVDTSPILSTSDPLVLSRLVDGLVMVVRAGKTPRACLSAAFRSVGSKKVMGIVLNGAQLGTSSRYYQYSPVA
jgi:non-specific protein-tyrosine kinase